MTENLLKKDSRIPYFTMFSNLFSKDSRENLLKKDSRGHKNDRESFEKRFSGTQK